MEWINRLNEAMRYMEQHMSDEIELEQAAKIACCSTYHFQRMFAYMANVPLAEYIRRRRMSLAAVDLQSSDAKIVDVALKYGYASPTAFNRAFQNVHGVAPSRVREEGISVKSFPPVSFTIMVKGVEEMNYRIENREAFRIVGISKPLPEDIEKSFEVVPPMWGQAAMDGTLEKLAGMMDSQPKGILGVSACHEKDNWKYYIAAASNMPAEGALEEFIIPASTWAVFPGEGTNISLQDLERRIITEWLPTSGYEYGNAPDVEVYLNPDPENAKYEVWISVIKKETSL